MGIGSELRTVIAAWVAVVVVAGVTAAGAVSAADGTVDARAAAGDGRPEVPGRPADGPGERPDRGSDDDDPVDEEPTAGITARQVDGLDDDWGGEPTWVPGTAGYDAGVWSFTDYPYDDAGTGEFTYPETAGYGGNAADPVVVQVALGLDAVHYLVRLNTLVVPDSTVVALAVDTDGDEATGGGPWPHGAKVDTAGWDHLITVSGASAVVDLAEGGDPIPIPVVADTVENLVEFAVPYEVADPRGGVWRYRGGAGLWDGEAGTWMEVEAGSTTDTATGRTSPATRPSGKSSPDHPNVFNLLFRNRAWDGGTDATDENGSGGFQSDRQAEALVSGELGDFHRDVDFSVLASGVTAAPEQPVSDEHFTRVYATEGFPNELSEGVRSEGATGRLLNGRYHPYIMFVPGEYWELDAPAPMFPLLHGWLGDHRGFDPSGNAFWTDVVRANGALVAKTTGRGGEIWYEHVGELDTLEVIADVARHYDVDDRRVYLGGTSMGGLGTVKIAEQHPDLFAGIFPSVPPMSDRAQGYAVPENNDWDLVELAGSLRNVPVRNFIGTYDGLVPAGHDPDRLCDALEELVYDHDCWRDVSSSGTHRGYENDRAAEIAQMLAEHRLDPDPAHVTYVSHPVFRRQAADTGLSHLLRYDSAYWVSGIRWPEPHIDGGCAIADCTQDPGIPTFPTDPGTPRRLLAGERISELDVRTYGDGIGDPVPEQIEDDPSPTLVRRGIVLHPGDAIPAANAFDLAVRDVLALDLDLHRMGLTLEAPLTAAITGEGSLELGLLSDSTAPCTATLDGVPLTIRHRGDRRSMALSLAGATATLRVVCA